MTSPFDSWRGYLIAAVIALSSLGVLGQILHIQRNPEIRNFFENQKEALSEPQEKVTPERGKIYDRQGNLLAGNKTVYEIGVDVESVQEPDSIAKALVSSIGADYETIYNEIVQAKAAKNQRYLILANYIPAKEGRALLRYIEHLKEESNAGKRTPDLEGLMLIPHLERSYPERTVASNILGFINLEGVAAYGVEGKYNEILSGAPVTITVPNNPNEVDEVPDVPKGTDLILTIHRDFQAEIETLLNQALVDYGAVSGVIVVMDSRTGEIWAMASPPQIDLNQYWEYGSIVSSPSEYNRAISMPYEPGSVFKVLTMAAAIDTGVVQPTTTYLDTGSILVGGSVIKNWNEKPWGMQDMIGCMQHSLNVCLAWVAVEMGPQTFYDYMNRFGIGHLTGIDLLGEAAGRLKIPGDADWYPVDLGTNSFGQGVSTTPIQMLMAASALANDGKMVTPHVVYAMSRENGEYVIPPQIAGEPISAETAHTMTEMLATALEREGSKALVPGYRVAGKTGTAQIPTPYGVYAEDTTNASFIGWGPVDDPRFMVYVWLEKPTSSPWGSETAAPLFEKVVEKTVLFMNIPPDSVREEMAQR